MANAHAHEEGHHHYVAPQSLLLKVLAALVFLTVLTVVTGTADWVPGWMHVPLALAIAGVKAGLVIAIFMGLKHDNPVNTLIASLSGIFVLIFLTFTLFDVVYRGDLSNVDPMTRAERQVLAEQDSVQAARYSNLRVAPGDYLVADSSDAAVPAADTAEADTSAADSDASADEPGTASQ